LLLLLLLLLPACSREHCIRFLTLSDAQADLQSLRYLAFCTLHTLKCALRNRQRICTKTLNSALDPL